MTRSAVPTHSEAGSRASRQPVRIQESPSVRALFSIRLSLLACRSKACTTPLSFISMAAESVFPPRAGADVKDGHSGLGTQRPHGAAAGDTLHKEKALVQHSQRLFRTRDDDGQSVVGIRVFNPLGSKAVRESPNGDTARVDAERQAVRLKKGCENVLTLFWILRAETRTETVGQRIAHAVRLPRRSAPAGTLGRGRRCGGRR